MRPVQGNVRLLFSHKPRLVPVRFNHVAIGEQLPYLGGVESFSFEMTIHHNVEQSFQRRNCTLYASIAEIGLGNPLLCLHNIEDTIGKLVHALQFGLKNIVGEYHIGIFKDPSEEAIHKRLRNPVSQN
ncbi:hypothetical protein SDC9_111037 [bioreactor metagenome]|uniref:Uncharacterized protein n=1 Tax=bioreactor metagenome TaxID=1076179 RepID=A0A645BHV8_9ZZZZ